MKKFLTMLSVALMFCGCDLVKQFGNAYQMTQCEYSFGSIENIIAADVNFSQINDLSDINPLKVASLLSSLKSTSGTLPVAFTLNLDVKNPGTQTAALQSTAFILQLDDKKITQGSLATPVQILAGATSNLPLTLSFDLKNVLKGEGIDKIKNVALALANYAGIDGLGNAEPVKMTLLVKPNMTIGGKTVSIPNYIPIAFTLK
jgi:hypothetical protein